MKNFLLEAQGLEAELIAVRRALHGCPETGDDLPLTVTLVRQWLIGIDCDAREICKGGLKCTIGGKKPGKAILLRADMDALPMAEQSGLPFAAQGNVAHACGHDLHTAMLLGAAKLLRKNEDELNGTVVLMFQPAEETAMGARAMIEAGVFDDPSVGAALALHVAPGQPTGRLNCTAGYKTASYDRFAIEVRGKGGHGAMPDKAIDPINAAVHIYTALTALMSRERDPAEPSVMTVGSFHAGTAGNIIPDAATMEAVLRTHSGAQREWLMKRAAEVSEAVAHAFRAQAHVTLLAGIPPMYCDPALTARLCGFARRLIGGRVDDAGEWLMASEDFALIAERVPTAYFTIGTGMAADGYAYGNHHPMVRYDEAAIATGAAVMAQCAMAWLNGEER